MKISVICVGKIKEKYFIDAINEYAKRLSKYINLNIIEVNDEKCPESLSEAEEENVKIAEGSRILNKIKDGYVVALAIDGKQMKSEELSAFISDKMVRGVSHIYFIIGGSLGLSNEVLNTADFKLSFSKMTFPHQLMRVVLLEQIYRAERIMKNEPYHK